MKHKEEEVYKKNIITKTIIKEIREVISNKDLNKEEKVKLSKEDKKKMIIKVESEMRDAASKLDFERALELRDILFELKSE